MPLRLQIITLASERSPYLHAFTHLKSLSLSIPFFSSSVKSPDASGLVVEPEKKLTSYAILVSPRMFKMTVSRRTKSLYILREALRSVSGEHTAPVATLR
jgi:hypothetical protein